MRIFSLFISVKVCFHECPGLAVYPIYKKTNPVIHVAAPNNNPAAAEPIPAPVKVPRMLRRRKKTTKGRTKAVRNPALIHFSLFFPANFRTAKLNKAI